MLDEEGLKKYIKSIKNSAEIDESVLTLSMLIDMLSYSTIDYRVLIIDKKNVIKSINSKLISAKLVDIVFSTNDNLSITFVFENASIKVCKESIDGEVSYETNGNLVSMSDKTFIDTNSDYVSKSLRILSDTVSRFSDDKSSVVDLANLYQNIICDDIAVAVSPIYKPLIFYKGIDVTNERVIRECMDSLFESIVIDKKELIPEFRHLYCESVESICK